MHYQHGLGRVKPKTPVKRCLGDTYGLEVLFSLFARFPDIEM